MARIRLLVLINDSMTSHLIKEFLIRSNLSALLTILLKSKYQTKCLSWSYPFALNQKLLLVRTYAV